MTDHDRLFKELLSTFFVEFIDLFFADVGNYLERGSIVFLEKELFSDITAGERYEADLVVKARFRDHQSFFLVHIENQTEAQSIFSYRMFRYFARLYEKYQLPIYPIAVFSFTEPLRAEPTAHRVAFPDFTVLEFHYRVVQLNRLDWRDFLRQPNPVASALMARMRIAPADRPRVKLECLRLLATLRLDPARTQLISGFVDTYLKLTAQEERLFAAELATIGASEQEAVVQIVTSWMQQGLEQGRQVGRQEGRQEEALAIVLRQLSRRLGTLPAQNAERVSGLSTTALEALSEALLDFASISDLDSWLAGQD
ncbi:DUF4351 domain-containing protein [Gloeobacter violaceus]|uniref:Gll2041 protein n=1 Tax=Gloeobacter violaceus (strain ATCC 29082 / PCC 7421) TaxID=251221 RepID=Q7NIZ1_GLOVI|nr:DUF4351 domain-containing protein [Gloeobacter violaceus]BAC89982.1 gll2041 [Gloeobacter violaceus PCC 7421]